MRKVLIVALGLAGIGVFGQVAVAKSLCQERRDACYARAERMADKDAASKCEEEYRRCVGAISAVSPGQPAYPAVRPVPGFGMPMQAPNPTVPVATNPGTPTFGSAAIITRTANVKVKNRRAPEAGNTTLSSSQGGSLPQGGSSSQGSSSAQAGSTSQISPPPGGGGKPSNGGASTGLKAN